MQRAQVAPNRTGLLGPMHPSYPIVVPRNESHDVISNHLVLIRIDIIDLTNMEPDSCEYRLPPSDWMSSDDGMGWCKLIPNVQR